MVKIYTPEEVKAGVELPTQNGKRKEITWLTDEEKQAKIIKDFLEWAENQDDSMALCHESDGENPPHEVWDVETVINMYLTK